MNVSESLRREQHDGDDLETPSLALPYQLAAMTVPCWPPPCGCRDDELAGKDDEHGPAGQHGQLHQAMSAAVTRILSARGSMNFPKSVTSPRLRARYPSIQSVQEMRMKMPAAMTHFAPW